MHIVLEGGGERVGMGFQGLSTYLYIDVHIVLLHSSTELCRSTH